MLPISRLPLRRLNPTLYLVADKPSFPNLRLYLTKIQEAVNGGVTCVQLRDYKSDFPTVLKTARPLKEMLKGKKVPLIINTLETIKVAQAIQADGVFLEEAHCFHEARRLLGNKSIIGVSVKTMDDLLMVRETNQIDYLSFKIAPSKLTCKRNDLIWDIEEVRKILVSCLHQVVLIGGLNKKLAKAIYRLLRPGYDGLAMAGGVMREEDTYQAAHEIQAIWKEVWGLA